MIVVLTAIGCGQDRPDAGKRTIELGERIAGTWLGTAEVDAPGFEPSAFIVTYHPSGTATATSERMFGAGQADENGLSSPHHIQWEPNGPQRIRWRVLHFGHDSEGHLTYISRTHGVREFDEDFESSSGSFQVEVFNPGTLLDPLDPNSLQAEPIATTKGTDVARRLHVRLEPH